MNGNRETDFSKIRDFDEYLAKLVEVLVEEEVLDNIRGLQELDILDIEGIWPIYQSLTKEEIAEIKSTAYCSRVCLGEEVRVF